jgi:hypothetical protein
MAQQAGSLGTSSLWALVKTMQATSTSARKSIQYVLRTASLAVVCGIVAAGSAGFGRCLQRREACVDYGDSRVKLAWRGFVPCGLAVHAGSSPVSRQLRAL